MELYFRGLEVPALGSPRDKIFRAYLSHEKRVESKRHELSLLIALATPSIADSNAKRSWNKEVTKTFNAYTQLMWGYEPEEMTKEDRDWTKFYEESVKKTAVRMTIGPKGKLIAQQISANNEQPQN